MKDKNQRTAGFSASASEMLGDGRQVPSKGGSQFLHHGFACDEPFPRARRVGAARAAGDTEGIGGHFHLASQLINLNVK